MPYRVGVVRTIKRIRARASKILMIHLHILLLLLHIVHANNAGCTAHSYCQATFPDPTRYYSPPGMSLLHVSAILRHGDRTPIEPLLNEQWRSLVEPAFQEEAGGLSGLLTIKGQGQHRQLGGILRDIYIKRLGFLPATFDPAILKVRSTHFSRTLHSAKALLSGLYPSIPSIPVEVEAGGPILTEHRSDCPRLRQLLRTHQDKSVYRHFRRQMRNLQGPSAISFFHLADNYFCMACRGASEGNEYCRVSREAFRFLIVEGAADREMAKLQAGALIGGIVSATTAAAFNDTRTFNILAAHDSTIAYLHGAFQTGQYEWPPYAANLLVEVWRKEESTPPDWNTQLPDPSIYIRIIYNGIYLVLPWCQEEDSLYCPLAHFLQFISSVIPTNMPSECKPVTNGDAY